MYTLTPSEGVYNVADRKVCIAERLPVAGFVFYKIMVNDWKPTIIFAIIGGLIYYLMTQDADLNRYLSGSIVLVISSAILIGNINRNGEKGLIAMGIIGILISVGIFMSSQKTTSKDYFYNDECTFDCSGHEAGYEWAENNGITDINDCGGYSDSFIEGCRAYVESY